MARFAVELRNSRGIANYKPIEGYLGVMGGVSDSPKYGVRGIIGIKNTDYIPYFTSRQEAHGALRSMADEFFDRYEVDVVELDENSDFRMSECETCLGNGRIKDADTGNIRRCLDCSGTGKVPMTAEELTDAEYRSEQMGHAVRR